MPTESRSRSRSKSGSKSPHRRHRSKHSKHKSKKSKKQRSRSRYRSRSRSPVHVKFRSRSVSASPDLDVKGDKYESSEDTYHSEKVKTEVSHGAKDQTKEKALLDKEREKPLDWNFDFKRYKMSLAKIFFADRYFSKISERGSQEHEDFWAFVSRYQEFQKKKQQKLQSNPPFDSSSDNKTDHGLNLPQKYDVQYKINISFLCKEFDVFLKKNR
ncbi:hypothetical protein EGW08_000113, partial [Elysia chlorotica]